MPSDAQASLVWTNRSRPIEGSMDAINNETNQAADQAEYDVVIVGGGLAGLQAAQTLLQARPPVSILLVEARNRLGGRVKHIEGLAPWPVELGPEFLHGRHHSSIKRLVDSMGCRQRELPYPDRYYFGSTKELLSGEEAERRADVALLHSLFSGLAEETLEGPDISVAEYLRKKGVSESLLQLAESIYANDFGCALEQLGLRECIHEAQNWIYGDTYLILDRPLYEVIDWLARRVPVKLDWPVASIQYSAGEHVRVTNATGQSVTATRAIITVPVTVLQEGAISFSPPLPAATLQALRSIGMANAVKVVLAFSHKFWPEDLFDIVCAGCFLPEIWMTEYPPVRSGSQKKFEPECSGCGEVDSPNSPKKSKSKSTQKSMQADPGSACQREDRGRGDARVPRGAFMGTGSGAGAESAATSALTLEEGPRVPLGRFVATGFVAGAQAAAISAMDPEEVVARAIAQMDEMFGTRRRGRDHGAEGKGAEEKSEGRKGEEKKEEGKKEEGKKEEGNRQDGKIGDEEREEEREAGGASPTGPSGDSCRQQQGPSRRFRKTPEGYYILPLGTENGTQNGAWKGTPKAPSDASLAPASLFFTGAYVCDWSKETHIRGAYTHPTVGAFGSRNALARPVGGRLFFAGEATHPGVNPCMQAALDTGERAAYQVLAAGLESRL